MTYAEYLKANGASEDEIKILDTAVSRRAFDKSQAEAEEARAAAAKLEETMKNYETRVQSWYTENDAKLKQVQNQAVAAAAEAAKHKAALLEAQRQGMIELAKGAGYDPEPPKPAGQPEGFDPAKFVTHDQLVEVARREGRGIAVMTKMAREHERLGLGDVDWERLFDDAQARNKGAVQYWEETYKVPEARQAAAAKQRDAEIAKWKAEGAKEKETELVSKFGNPETRPMLPSRSPFTVRKEDPLRADNQPWNKSETQLQNDRVTRAAQKLVERQANDGFKN